MRGTTSFSDYSRNLQRQTGAQSSERSLELRVVATMIQLQAARARRADGGRLDRRSAGVRRVGDDVAMDEIRSTP